MTPYAAQTYRDRGIYFTSHGLAFLSVDVRGTGKSGGEFQPFIQEASDAHDVVEWLAKQPYCNGKIGMWGGSYADSRAEYSCGSEYPRPADAGCCSSSIGGGYHGNLSRTVLMMRCSAASACACQRWKYSRKWMP
jgi:hypothetical protein